MIQNQGQIYYRMQNYELRCHEKKEFELEEKMELKILRMKFLNFENLFLNIEKNLKKKV